MDSSYYNISSLIEEKAPIFNTCQLIDMILVKGRSLFITGGQCISVWEGFFLAGVT